MLPLLECQIDLHASATNDPYLVELEEAALDPARWPDIEELLRALTRSLLDAAATMRFEAIEPYELALEFAAGQISGAMEDPGDEPGGGASRYILGRIDALLDVCDMAVDRSVSQATLEAARGRHVTPILGHLRQEGETRAGDLAEAVGIERNHLSNILKRLEEAGLVRRASVGRSTLVTLGPKAAAVYTALQDEPCFDMQVEDFDLGELNTAQSERIAAVAVERATAA